VSHIVLSSYAIGWAVASICLAFTPHKTQGPPRPQLIVVAAGALWPLLVLGAAQLVAVVLITEMARGRGGGEGSTSEHGLEYSDDELHALIDDWRADFEQRR
jgi:hypothetical protein